jgi:hypothetical protein
MVSHEGEAKWLRNSNDVDMILDPTRNLQPRYIRTSRSILRGEGGENESRQERGDQTVRSRGNWEVRGAKLMSLAASKSRVDTHFLAIEERRR